VSYEGASGLEQTFNIQRHLSGGSWRGSKKKKKEKKWQKKTAGMNGRRRAGKT